MAAERRLRSGQSSGAGRLAPEATRFPCQLGGGSHVPPETGSLLAFLLPVRYRVWSQRRRPSAHVGRLSPSSAACSRGLGVQHGHEILQPPMAMVGVRDGLGSERLDAERGRHSRMLAITSSPPPPTRGRQHAAPHSPCNCSLCACSVPRRIRGRWRLSSWRHVPALCSKGGASTTMTGQPWNACLHGE